MNKSIPLTALLFLTGTLTLLANDGQLEFKVKSVIIEGALQGLLQSKLAAPVSSHPLLDLGDLTELAATLGGNVLSPDGDAIGAKLVGKYRGRKLVVASICTINWCSRKVSGNDLINEAEHQYFIKRAKDVVGIIESPTAGMIITSVVNSNSSIGKPI